MNYSSPTGETTPQSSSLENTTRFKYLSSHIEAMLHSLSRKDSNIKGYSQWSLMDFVSCLEGMT
ncbi:unnamed protein product [Brassica rapa subsp. narinosa]